MHGISSRWWSFFAGLALLLPGGHRLSGNELPATVTNLRLAGSGAVFDDLALFVVNEGTQGGQDFNGDGDSADGVLHTRNLVTGETVNLGLAIAGDALASHELIAFLVSEQGQSNLDLNGDGDTDDFVVHVLDRATKELHNLGLAAGRLRLSGGNLAFVVGEAAQGNTDLNGDGDVSDIVVHVWHRSAPPENLALALPISTTTSPPEILLLDGSLLGMTVGENEQGVDLNGDGDAIDTVMHVYDFDDGVLRDLELALGDSSTSAPATRLWALSSTMVLFGVSEAAQGGVSLNGDADTLDLVTHVYLAPGGSVRNLGLASVTTTFHAGYLVGASFGAFLVGELNQGNTILNGDGDLDDVVAFVYDQRTDSVHGLGLSVKRLFLNQDPAWQATGRYLAFQVSELGELRDLNGDGDTGNDGERVLHVYALDSGTTTNLGLAVADAQAGNGQVAFRVSELFQGNQDLTGDGDTTDRVLYVHDLRTGLTRGSATAADDNYVIASDVVLFSTEEFFQQRDLNGDGDTSDTVAGLFGLGSGRVRNLALAVPRIGPFSLRGHLSPRRTALIVVSESDQGLTDLNGDGDVSFDWTLHQVDVHESSRIR